SASAMGIALPISYSATNFGDVANLFIEKANSIVGKRKLSGPGSEYTNAAIGKQGSMNPSMGLRIHKRNPKGVKCTNTNCEGLTRADNHDVNHCYYPGGGMESKAPAWAHAKTQTKETAAVAATTPPSTSTTSTPETHRRELSCAAITSDPDELTCLSSTHPLLTILDSGTTSHLVMDHQYFLDFAVEDRPPVKMANHGQLITTGRGTCVADVTIGGDKYRLTLKDFLHAPGALLNLLSVGRMLQRGWDCDFKGSKPSIRPHCQLSYKGDILGNVPLIGNLCFLELQFIHPNELLGSTPLPKEICAFVKIPLTWDLWHA
ncbi:hypothetical protein PAXRUDRAFT_77538, partial [Paxillus rubicundulus Ve08.2h10]